MAEDQPAGSDASFDIGVLFIHGIGAQIRGQTLVQFGGPIYQWIVGRFLGLDRRWHGAQVPPAWRQRIESWADDGFLGEPNEPTAAGNDGGAHDGWPTQNQIEKLAKTVGCDTVVGRASLTEVTIAGGDEEEAPAHGTLTITRRRTSGTVEHERWLLAESWWAETFAAPDFGELARWGMRIGPWTIGRHFGSRFRRRWLGRPVDAQKTRHWLLTRQGVAWLWGFVSAVVAFAVALALSPFYLLVLASLLLVGILPIPQLRSAILSIQLRAASTIGDSFVLVTRPVEAASIVSQVRRDLEWLAGKCDAVVVVAHSQGGAVAHQALREAIPEKLKLLFTFGSGLKKLEELKQSAATGGSYEISAIWTLLALVLFSVTLWWFAFGAATIAAEFSRYVGQVGAMLFWSVISLAFLWAGLKDHVQGIELPSLRRWINRLTSTGVTWVDAYASDDPVSNGPLFETTPADDRSIEVTNMRSMLRDHVTYWANRDEFIGLLVGHMMAPTVRTAARLPLIDDLTTDNADVQEVRADRRWRLGIRRAIVALGGVSVGLAVLRAWPATFLFLRYLFETGMSAGATLFGLDPKPVVSVVLNWSAIGWFALALGPYWIAVGRWRAWNEQEMDLAVQRLRPSPPMFVGLAVVLQIVIGAAALYPWRDEPPTGWILIAAFLFVIPSIILPHARQEVRAKGKGPSAADPSHGAPQSHVNRTANEFWALLMPAIAAFGLGLAAWDGLARIFGYFRPDAWPTTLINVVPQEGIGAAGAVIVLAIGGWLRFKSRRT